MTQSINISALTEIAIKAAIKAGKEILNVYYNSDFNVELKADNSPLTVADKRAHNVITEVLGETEIPVLSEEGKTIPYVERKKWKYVGTAFREALQSGGGRSSLKGWQQNPENQFRGL